MIKKNLSKAESSSHGSPHHEPPLIQSAFDNSVKTIPILLVHQSGANVDVNELDKNSKANKVNFKAKFPSRNASSDLKEDRCAICMENYIKKKTHFNVQLGKAFKDSYSPM